MATHIFKELVDEQSHDFTKPVFEASNINFTVGVCELQEIPNKKNGVDFIYDESKIKHLYKEFKTYQNIIGKLIKYSKQNKIGLIIPLLALI